MTMAIAVGFNAARLDRFCADAHLATRLDDHVNIDNGEQGAPIWVCSRLRAPWSVLWPKLKNLG